MSKTRQLISEQVTSRHWHGHVAKIGLVQSKGQVACSVMLPEVTKRITAEWSCAFMRSLPRSAFDQPAFLDLVQCSEQDRDCPVFTWRSQHPFHDSSLFRKSEFRWFTFLHSKDSIFSHKKESLIWRDICLENVCIHAKAKSRRSNHKWDNECLEYTLCTAWNGR